MQVPLQVSLGVQSLGNKIRAYLQIFPDVLDMIKFWYYTFLDSVHKSRPAAVHVHKYVKQSGGKKDLESFHAMVGQSEQCVQ